MPVHTIRGRNIGRIYELGRTILDAHGVHEETRNGPALVLPGPTVTEMQRPRERVLFDAARDANPFFHIVESVWMLAGWNNGTILDRYVRDFTSRYAEPESGGELHGAYGYRWREMFGCDQLFVVGDMLRKDPGTRRAVVQMWSPEEDLAENKRDLPCNTQLLFRSRRSPDGHVCLDMTVVNRSNDMVWGAYGANVVHMSILLEVVAALADMRVGTMYTLSNNMHGYVDVLQKMPADLGAACPYENGTVVALPIFDAGSALPDQARTLLEEDAHRAMGYIADFDTDLRSRIQSRWLRNTVLPMVDMHQRGRTHGWASALEYTHTIEATDWRRAATLWTQKRSKVRAEQGS